MKSHRSRRQLSPRRFPQCSAAVAALVFACSNQNGDGVPPQENERDASVELSTDTAVSSEATEPSALESELEPLTEDSELEPGSLLAEPNVSSEESGEGATHQSVDGGIDPTESASAAATHNETAQEETGDETTRTETPREETAPDESQPDDTTGVVESSDDSTPSAGAGGVNNSGGAASTAQGGSAGNGGGTGFGGAPGFGGTAGFGGIGFGGTGLGGNPTVGGMGGTTPSPGPTFGNVHAVLSVWCVPCHDENQREGGRTHGQADIDAAYADIEIIGAEPIAAMVSSRMMPPFDAPNGALTQDQIDLIIAWVNVGAPR